MKDTLKLYKVLLTGAIDKYNPSYVIAIDSDSAYKQVRTFLDKEDLGYARDRELKSVELVAENYHYTDTPSRLLLPEQVTATAKGFDSDYLFKDNVTGTTIEAYQWGSDKNQPWWIWKALRTPPECVGSLCYVKDSTLHLRIAEDVVSEVTDTTWICHSPRGELFIVIDAYFRQHYKKLSK